MTFSSLNFLLNSIPSLIDTINYNISRNIKDLSIFEVSNVYYKKDKDYEEETLLSAALYGTYLENSWQAKKVEVDFYLVKGVLVRLLNYLKLNNRYEFKTINIPKEFHPGRSAALYVDNDLIGYIGEVHPSISKNRIYVFELSVNKLMDKKIRAIKMKEISKYPIVSKDMAFILDKNITAAEVIKEIKRVGGKILTEIDVFDVYVGDKIDSDKKSIAFNLKFQDNTKTLTDDEVMSVFHKIIDGVINKFNAALRDK